MASSSSYTDSDNMSQGSLDWQDHNSEEEIATSTNSDQSADSRNQASIGAAAQTRGATNSKVKGEVPYGTWAKPDLKAKKDGEGTNTQEQEDDDDSTLKGSTTSSAATVVPAKAKKK